jgi:fused signal recognition particle receptor
VLKANNFDFTKWIEERNKPVVIMFVGVNGTGKTLSIAKMACLLHKMGKSCVMAAGDTFRAGAIEQLTIHADNLGVKIIKHGPGSDPAAVAFDAIEHAKAKHKDVVLLDTAGRMQTNSNLMDEMAKIKRVAKPDMIIFVGDALSGNDAVEQAKRFNEVVGIDGVILTKVDADAKGGSSLSIAYTIGKPLLFIGVGQGYEDQIPFNPEWMVLHIFGK